MKGVLQKAFVKYILDNSKEYGVDVVDNVDNTLVDGDGNNSVTSGKKFYLGVLIITNKTGVQDEVDIWDGASSGQSFAKLNILVSNSVTTVVDFTSSYPEFISSIVVQSSNAAPGTPLRVRMIGMEI